MIRRAATTTTLVAGLLAFAGCRAAHNAPATPVSASTPAAKTVKAWPAEWCRQAAPGMTRSELERVMGKPTGRFADQYQWEAFGYAFTAFFDADGTARQLDWDAATLTGAQRARIHCPQTRT
jgi:outer membrane protein assembly factor BamE (lipoprotein component of BamABCDE complex)